MIAAVVLAAGLSRRMGRPKLPLPWGEKTVIEKVVQSVLDGGVEQVLVVTGGARQEVEAALDRWPVQFVFNPHYADQEMLVSLQIGLRALGGDIVAALVCLGDQPQIQAEVVRKIYEAYQQDQSAIVVPSYHMRRGHPWLLPREHWNEVLALPAESNLRAYLQTNAGIIHYVVVDTPSILADLDTPQDYQAKTPGR